MCALAQLPIHKPSIVSCLRKYLWIILAVVPVVLFSKALYFGFVWDDTGTLFKILPHYKHLFAVFKSVNIPEFPNTYYRPITFLSWYIDQQIWGVNAFGYHLTEVLLHAMNVVLVYFLAKKLLSKYSLAQWGAFATAMLFAVHPVQTETVCWISARPEELFTAFSLASFLMFLQYRKSQESRWLISSTVSWFIALLSKETAVAILPCLILYDFFFKDDKSKISLRPYLLFIIVFCVYFFLRNHYLPDVSWEFSKDIGVISSFKKIIGAYGFYIQRSVFPISPGGLVFGLPESTSFILGSIMVLASIFFAGIWAFCGGNRLVLYHICFFLITLLPSLFVAVTTFSETPVAERYLYMPSYAVCFMIGLIIVAGPTYNYIKLLKIIFFLLLFILFSYKATLRMPVWQDEFTLWRITAAQYPDQAPPLQRLGFLYQGRGDYQRAIEHYKKALSAKYKYRQSDTARVYSNLGMIYYELKKYDESEEFFQKALKESDEAFIYYNLGLLYFQRANDSKNNKKEMLNKAVYFLEECQKRTPDDIQNKQLLEQVRGLL